MNTETNHRKRTRRGTARALGVALNVAAVLASGVVAVTPAHAQTLTVLYSFKGATDGENPVASLVRDVSGNLYGTTGCNYCASAHGSVFKVDPHGNETTLYSFSGGTDGGDPYGSLLLDGTGNLYGTTLGGGAYRGGTVFKLDAKGKETVLYDFRGYPSDGAEPFAGLIRDSLGNFYGTTFDGGSSEGGTVFKLDPSGNETVLHTFAGFPADGEEPAAALVRDGAGNLYGTTFQGGAYGGGVVFKLDAAGVETILHNFTLGSPQAALVQDAAGNLYGTAFYGGSESCSSGYPGCGTVFKLSKTTGNGNVLYSFLGTPDGSNPVSTLVRDAAANVYGTTFLGGVYHAGTVFKLDKTGKETVLYSFTGGADGANPEAGLVMDAAGNLYGTTYLGGDLSCFPPYGCGAVFKLAPE